MEAGRRIAEGIEAITIGAGAGAVQIEPA